MKEYVKLEIKLVYLNEDILTQSNALESEKEKDVGWGELFG